MERRVVVASGKIRAGKAMSRSPKSVVSSLTAQGEGESTRRRSVVGENGNLDGRLSDSDRRFVDLGFANGKFKGGDYSGQRGTYRTIGSRDDHGRLV